jgi:predicted short-subunit dehydrogenase-like oxidoreductase (DUF2520 family)
MPATTDARIGILGAGRAGRALAVALRRAGAHIAAVASRTQASAARLAADTDAQVSTSRGLPSLCDVILVAVPDDAIPQADADLAAFGKLEGRIIVHTSGVHDSAVLAGAERAGAMTGSLHPAFAFSDEGYALAHLHEAVFAIESKHAVVRVALDNLVKLLGARAIVLPPGMKAQYHAGLVIASNYLVTLYAAAAHLLRGAGAGEDDIPALLLPLMRATLGNLSAQGPAALTGPISRGDAGTVARHVAALAGQADTIQALYQAMGLATLPLAQLQGLPDAQADAVRRALKG